MAHNNDTFAYRSRKMPGPLDPSYIKIDERSMADLMVFAGKYSRLVNYYDHDTINSGTWAPFFEDDQDVLLASLLRVDLDAYENCFYENWDAVRATNDHDQKFTDFSYLFKVIIEIPLRIDMLYRNTAGREESQLVHELKQTITTKLSSELAKLVYYAKAAGNKDALDKPIDLGHHRLSDLWDVTAPSGLPDIYNGDTANDKMNKALDPIGDIFEEFIYALRYIRSHISIDIESIYLERNDHKPHIALYIAFLKLFSYAQDELNTITQRHLDLYYYDVLRQGELTAIPDKAFVAFELALGTAVYPLPAGTRLIGGKSPGGAPKVYTTDRDIYINSASIASLRTLFISSNPLVSYRTKKNLVNNIYYKGDPAAVPGIAWPALGEEQLEMGDENRTMSTATIGFALSSPAFILTEGEREVSAEITFDSTGFTRLWDIAKEIGIEEYRSPASVLKRIFSHGFRIRISATSGWLAVERYIVVPDLTACSIRLQFHFTMYDPPVTGYDAAVHGNAYKAQFPLLEVVFDDSAPVYAYSLLKDLSIKDIRITAEVTGIRRPDIFNNLGRVAPGKPFQAFGPFPVVGSYLLVGKSEMMSKELQYVRLRLDWQELPPRGFGDYYRGYNMGITNDCFKVKLSMLKSAGWIPAPPVRQSFGLFVEDDKSTVKGALAGTTVFDTIDISKIRTTPRFDLPLVLEYPEITEGLFRLELTDPPFAFAQSEYNAVLSNTIANNIRKKENHPVPNLPYIPVVTSLTVDYKASLGLQSQDVNGTPAIRMFHIHPFGIRDLDHASGILNNNLVPQYNDEGTLFIGLSGLVPPQPLNLFFEFDGGTGDPDGHRASLEWSYLANDSWHTFEQDSVLCDTTEQLTSTGIISLDIPASISNDNAIMPAGLYWIKVSAAEYSGRVCKILGLITQAVNVTGVDAADPLEVWSPIPPGTIKQLESNIPQIKKIIQPVASYGGKGAEEKSAFYQRVSERLRHRYRAINPADYEQLVMQYFPEVSSAICIPCASSDQSSKPRPGHVMIVVIPASRKRVEADTYPTVNAGVLQKIEELFNGNIKEYQLGMEKDLKESLISPFVKLEVRNPSYERVKIACAVRFKRGYDSGFYMTQMNNDLGNYISPWLNDPAADAAVGQSLYRSNILGFIEHLPYVDFVTRFSIIVIRGTGGRFELLDSADERGDYRDEIKTEFRWSLLVSDDHHAIDLYDEGNDDPKPRKRSISNMIISEDFIIR